MRRGTQGASRGPRAVAGDAVLDGFGHFWQRLVEDPTPEKVSNIAALLERGRFTELPVTGERLLVRRLAAAKLPSFAYPDAVRSMLLSGQMFGEALASLGGRIPEGFQRVRVIFDRTGTPVRLISSAFATQSGIDFADDVWFCLGDAPGPDGKPVQGTLELKKAAGVIKDSKENGQYRYAAELTLPKVTQGVADRRQPGVKVWLIDQSGHVAAEGKTDKCGLATFEKVIPGTYTVWGVKDADQNAQDWKTVVARGGDEIDVDLSVKRQLSPPIQPPQR